MTVQWGILGPGNIAEAFATGLAAIDSGTLAAVGSRDGARSLAFGERYGVDSAHCHGSYAALVADPSIDAVYIATPHPWHREHSEAALAQGKHVLCEKPAGMTAEEVRHMVDCAVRHERFFMEAFMYRSHPLIARIRQLLFDGAIGEPLHVDACFGFAVPRDPSSRLFDPHLGGGGILDVGCYPVSFVRLVAGVCIGDSYDEPVLLKGFGQIGPSGVDEVAHALLRFRSGLTASIGCAIVRDLGSRLHVRGTLGSLRVERDCWIPGTADVAAARRMASDGPDACIVLESDGDEARYIDIPHALPLYAYEADVASRAIAMGDREAPAPAPDHADSIGNAVVLDRWCEEVARHATCGPSP